MKQFLAKLVLEDGTVVGGVFSPIADDDLPRPSPNPAGVYHTVNVDQWGRVVGGGPGDAVVTTFNTRTGDVTLTELDVITADPNIVHTNTGNNFSVASFTCADTVPFNLSAGDGTGVDAGNLSFRSGNSVGQGQGALINAIGGKVAGNGGTIQMDAGAGVDEFTGGSIAMTSAYGGSVQLAGQGGVGFQVKDDFGSGSLYLGWFGAAVPQQTVTGLLASATTVADLVATIQSLLGALVTYGLVLDGTS